MKILRIIALIAASLGTTHAATMWENFNPGDFDMSLYGVGTIANESRSKDELNLGGGVGGTYWITRGFGVGGVAELSDFNHSVIDLGMGRLSVRAPLWDKVSPYGWLDGGFQFETDQWHVRSGGGLELRLAKTLGLFAEVGLGVTTRGAGYGVGRMGIRIPLSF
jgi:hypothetical protein